ncbi:MAG TPA: calcium-binding protein [Candidatus Limnocylindrales bacterium]
MWAKVLWRGGVVAAVVAVQGALLSGVAHAATDNVFLNGTVVHYEAGSLGNTVKITRSGTNIIIDSTEALDAGAGCWGLDRSRVACADGGVTAVRVDGNGGNDIMTSQIELPVSFWGGDGDDTLTGGPGDDTLRGEGDSDKMSGGTGRDAVSYYGRVSDVHADLDGASGDDGYIGEGDTIGSDVEELYGGTGDDTLVGNVSANYINGNEGNDTIRGGGGEDTIHGSVGDDWIEGDAGDDRLYGDGGNDTLRGDDHNDVLSGGPDDDVLQGGNGEDVLLGEAGNDDLNGNGGLDLLDGGPDGDLCFDLTPWVQMSCE